MMRTLVAAAVVAGFALGLSGRPASAGIDDVDFQTFDARILDRKGVSTDLTELGYATGVNIFMAYRGEAEVEIPWRLIRTLEFGEFVPETRRGSVVATLRSGKTVALEIDAVEEARLLRAHAEFGDYRIRMGKVRRIELIGFSQGRKGG